MDKQERLKLAMCHFEEVLFEHQKDSADAALMLTWITPLFDQIRSGQVFPPQRYTLRMALGKDSSFYEPSGPFSKVESDFAAALEDWPSQPWYKDTRD